MSAERLQEIMNSLRAAYGSLEEPNYSFAEKRLQSLRHHSLIIDLMSRYSIRDITDLSDHLALHLEVRHAEGANVVCLSCIDHWSMLFRLAFENPIYDKIIEPSCYGALGPERDIVQLLQKYGFKMLTKVEAAFPVSIKLFNTESNQALVYHALISDDGVVPQVLL
jgi:hypothetical protein